MPNEKLLPPGVSIVSASDAQMMKVRVESYSTREQAEKIVEANKPFYQGEIRHIENPASPDEYEIWKPATRMQIDFLPLAKRGDLIRFLIRFSPGNVGTEFVTAVVIGKANGLIRCKVYSRPEKTQFHSVEYGDELVINENQVITHEQSTAAVVGDVEPFLTGVIPISRPVNAEDAKIRAVSQNLPSVTPEAGKQYWTRNGTQVTVWTRQTQKTVLCSACGRQQLGTQVQNEMCPQTRTYHSWVERDRTVWLGGSPDGAAIEWNLDGSHAGGLRDLDIVKDPRMNEVIA
jgi:hypothetical protein